MHSLPDTFQWLQQHVIEIFAVITGLLYVIFAIKEKILLWLFGIISSALYIWWFYRTGFQAFAVLNVYYVVIGFYGWYNWGREDKRNTGDNSGSLVIKRTPLKKRIVFIFATFAIAVLIYFILVKWSGSELPLIDAGMTSAGIVATWMLTQKYIEQWIFWIIIDLVTMGAMIYVRSYPSAFLYLVYALLAIKGYVQWNKELRAHE